MKVGVATKLILTFIVLSSLLMRQILALFSSVFGSQVLKYGIYSGFALILISLFVLVCRSSLPKLHLTAGVMSILCMGLVLINFGQPEEWAHILYFALLTASLINDGGVASRRIVLRSVVLSTIFSALDEGLQALLPYRVGDLRDILFGFGGSLCGASLAWFVFLNRSKIER